MKSLIIILTIFFFSKQIYSQNEEGILLPHVILDGDTIPYITLPEVVIWAWRPYKSKKDEQNAKRLINNVKKVLPYARLAAAKMKYYDDLALKAKSEGEKKRIQKKAEEDLKNQFESDIRDMTRIQGKLLIKLIDRETGKSTYEIIKLNRGTFKAIFWNSLSSAFGISLKEKYDPEGDDKTIEHIINLIEQKRL